MWLTVLFMALAVSTEPFRLGMTVLMLNRARPAVDLLAFLIGGFVMGITVGLIVLFALRPVADAGADSSAFTLPKVQIGIGLVALAAAAVLAVLRPSLTGPSRTGPDSGAAPAAGAEPGRLARHARRLMSTQSPWVAGVAGLGIALPSIDYLAALAVILASEAPATHQIGALVMFNAVAFAMVEVPLIAYLFAPEKTRAAMARLNGWFAANRRSALALTLAVIGSVLLGVGVLTS